MAFTKKHALVSGGSRGIGRGIALKLAELGAKVGVHYYKNEKAAQETLSRIRELGSDGFVVQGDITQPEDISKMFGAARSEFGSLDIFISNARPEAGEFFYPPMDITLEQWDKAFDSQAKAFLVAAREAAELLRDGGRIVALTYAAGSRTGSLQPWVGMGSAKAALETLVRYFAVALAGRGITVNAISPGWTDDTVLNTLPDAVQTAFKNWHGKGWTPMKRLGTPADIGDAVSLLCADEAQWITGQIIHADGGASLMNPEVPTEIQLG